jgi:hypothetical protein
LNRRISARNPPSNTTVEVAWFTGRVVETAFVVLSDNYWLDLVSSTEISNGTVGLQYRRHR